MRNLIMAAMLAGILAAMPGLAEEQTFQIDPVHSSVQFRIRHLYSTFVGRFNKFEGTLSGDPADPSTLKVAASVAIASIDTANADREKHLKTPDFFDAEHFPAATFVSTRSATGDVKEAGSVIGRLTIRGVTKEVTFRGKLTGQGADSKGATRAGFHATATINRKDFGVAYNASLPNGMTLLGDEVELVLELEAVETKAVAKAP